ncbi:MAG: sporulation transcription factor Spo0A [Lachnospiraceae bacterium]|nr:sporulation transcription factor Spo0A [Lachnospiraceae bacterium]
MNNIRVVLAESDATLIYDLKTIISDDDMLCLAGEASDGETAWNIIESTQPDVVITELLIPRIDGLTLVEKINNSNILKKKPKIIVTSTMSSEAIVRETIKLGVSYFVMKPYNAECIVSRAKKISYSIEHFSPMVVSAESVINEYISKFGIPEKLKGYVYLNDAIVKVMMDDSMLYGVTKILYPEVAKKYRSTAVRVEKAIRHAIEVAWKKKSLDMRKEYYGYDTEKFDKRPTNSEFIARAVRELKIAE